MEEDMEMDEDIHVYEAHEVDFDYEFDAARFFDFSKPESDAQARLSELWFDSAPTCPPSPFVAKLFPMEDMFSQNVDVSPKSKYGDTLLSVDGDSGIDQISEYCDQDEEDRGQRRHVSLLHNFNGCNLPDSRSRVEGVFGGLSKGLSFYNHFANDMKKTNSKSLAKPYMPRSSTLMKPTASQLAKQNQRRQVCDSRFQKNNGSSNVQCGTENHASKRQKLDGGQLRRIVDTKLPVNLIHKNPKKDGALQGMNSTKLRITIPQEPDLETTHRAERIRLQSQKGGNLPSTKGRFRARPLMEKIPEAPVQPIPKRTTQHLQDSQDFRFKTTERAKSHTFTATAMPHCQSVKGSSKVSAASIVETGNNDMKRSDAVAAPKFPERQLGHSFKARPLDRKILTSRGDLGVFRNSKRDVTVPKAFEFQTSKRNQQNPPIDLFSKLSLAGESQPKNCAQQQLPQKSCLPTKGSKENRWDSCQQDQNMKLQARETLNKHSGKLLFNVSSVGVTAIGPGNGQSRTCGIWRK